MRGLDSRLVGRHDARPYRARLESELDVIAERGAATDFLFVHEIVSWATSCGIAVGPGRGSTPGAVTCWALGITDVDPIKHRLLFERFLNHARDSRPILDLDVCIRRRDEVVDHVVERYGRDHAAVVRCDEERGFMEIPPPILDEVVGREELEEIDRALRSSGPTRLAEILASDPELAACYRDVEVRAWFEGAIAKAEDSTLWFRRTRKLIVSARPLAELMTVDRSGRWPVVELESRESLRDMFSLDLEGLPVLTTLEAAGARKDPPNARVWSLLAAGDTDGVFQLDGNGMRALCRRLCPGSFDDVAAMIALYRPGPLEAGMLDEFVDCRHGRKLKHGVEYPSLREILADTHGVLIYQEQLMEIVTAVAGFDLANADLMRRALGSRRDVDQYQRAFVAGSAHRGMNSVDSEQLFDWLAHAAKYLFNRAHAVAYTTLTLQSAWLATQPLTDRGAG